MRRLLLNQGLAPQAAAILRGLELDAVHVSEIGMYRAHDVAILNRAVSEGQVCVTLDHDFHAHLAMAESGIPSLILLRVQCIDAHGQADLIQLIWGQCEAALQAGAAG